MLLPVPDGEVSLSDIVIRIGVPGEPPHTGTDTCAQIGIVPDAETGGAMVLGIKGTDIFPYGSLPVAAHSGPQSWTAGSTVDIDYFIEYLRNVGDLCWTSCTFEGSDGCYLFESNSVVINNGTINVTRTSPSNLFVLEEDRLITE